MQRHGAIADLPEEKDRTPRRLLQRERELVSCHLCLERAPQRVLGPEEAVGGHQPLDPLVGTEVVVVAEVVLEALLGAGEVLG